VTADADCGALPNEKPDLRGEIRDNWLLLLLLLLLR